MIRILFITALFITQNSFSMDQIFKDLRDDQKNTKKTAIINVTFNPESRRVVAVNHYSDGTNSYSCSVTKLTDEKYYNYNEKISLATIHPESDYKLATRDELEKEANYYLEQRNKK